MKTKITLEVLDKAKHGDFIANGYFIDGGKTNICDTKKKIRWVAVRGIINDFAIYCEYIYADEDPYVSNNGDWGLIEIARVGDKVPSYIAKELIDIEDNILKKHYRN